MIILFCINVPVFMKIKLQHLFALFLGDILNYRKTEWNIYCNSPLSAVVYKWGEEALLSSAQDETISPLIKELKEGDGKEPGQELAFDYLRCSSYNLI